MHSVTLAVDLIPVFSVLALGRRNRQNHPPADGAGEESAEGMRLPDRSFHQLFRRYTPPTKNRSDSTGFEDKRNLDYCRISNSGSRQNDCLDRMCHDTKDLS